MNKKSVIAILLAFTLLASVLANIHLCQAWVIVSDENHIRFYLFTLYSPLNGTYNNRFLDLNLTFTAGMGIKYTIYYLIDDKYVDTVPFTVKNASELHVTVQAKVFTQLPPLSEGPHSLTVVINCAGLMRRLPSNNGTVYFTIDSNASKPFVPQPTTDLTPPEITKIYMQNQTDQTEASLHLTIDEAGRIRQVNYSLDGAENKTIPETAQFWSYDGTSYYSYNLTELKSGYHKIVVYVTDTAGNMGVSGTVFFFVNSTFPELSNLAVNSALIAALCVVATVALGFWLKRKRNQGIVNDISLGKLG